MITGYNHNVRHEGRIYHIQTEDSGIQYAHIITHLFVGGNIISSKKSSYGHLLGKGFDEDRLEKEIQALMKDQHKDMMRELKGGAYDHIGTFKKEGEALTPGEGGAQKVRNTSLSGGPQVGGIGGLPGMTAAAADGAILDLDATSGVGDVEAELEQSLEAMMSDIDSLLTDEDAGVGRGGRDRAASRSPRRGRERPLLARDRPAFPSALVTKADMPTLDHPEGNVVLDTSSVSVGTQQATSGEKPSERLRAQRRERPSLDLRPPNTPTAAQPFLQVAPSAQAAPPPKSSDPTIDALLRAVLSASKGRVDRATSEMTTRPSQKVHVVVRGWDLRQEAAQIAEQSAPNTSVQAVVSSFLRRDRSS